MLTALIVLLRSIGTICRGHGAVALDRRLDVDVGLRVCAEQACIGVPRRFTANVFVAASAREVPAACRDGLAIYPAQRKGKKRATCREARSTAGESRGVSEGNWLLGLDSNQQPSG